MYLGRLEHDWSVASHIMATVANIFRSSGRAMQPKDFNPLMQKAPENIRPLKEMDKEFR